MSKKKKNKKPVKKQTYIPNLGFSPAHRVRPYFVPYFRDDLPQEVVDLLKRLEKKANYLFSQANIKIENAVSLPERVEGINQFKKALDIVVLMNEINTLSCRRKKRVSVKKDAVEGVIAVLKSLYNRGNEPSESDWEFVFFTPSLGGEMGYRKIVPNLSGLINEINNDIEFEEWVKEKYENYCEHA